MSMILFLNKFAFVFENGNKKIYNYTLKFINIKK